MVERSNMTQSNFLFQMNEVSDDATRVRLENSPTQSGILLIS